jgi:hypothetical protein
MTWEILITTSAEIEIGHRFIKQVSAVANGSSAFES